MRPVSYPNFHRRHWVLNPKALRSKLNYIGLHYQQEYIIYHERERHVPSSYECNIFKCLVVSTISKYGFVACVAFTSVWIGRWLAVADSYKNIALYGNYTRGNSHLICIFLERKLKKCMKERKTLAHGILICSGGLKKSDAYYYCFS